MSQTLYGYNRQEDRIELLDDERFVLRVHNSCQFCQHDDDRYDDKRRVANRGVPESSSIDEIQGYATYSLLKFNCKHVTRFVLPSSDGNVCDTQSKSRLPIGVNEYWTPPHLAIVAGRLLRQS